MHLRHTPLQITLSVCLSVCLSIHPSISGDLNENGPHHLTYWSQIGGTVWEGLGDGAQPCWRSVTGGEAQEPMTHPVRSLSASWLLSQHASSWLLLQHHPCLLPSSPRLSWTSPHSGTVSSNKLSSLLSVSYTVQFPAYQPHGVKISVSVAQHSVT